MELRNPPSFKNLQKVIFRIWFVSISIFLETQSAPSDNQKTEESSVEKDEVSSGLIIGATICAIAAIGSLSTQCQIIIRFLGVALWYRNSS